MKVYKCQRCNHDLYTANDKGTLDVEIQCPACNLWNYPHRDTPEKKVKGLKGSAFESTCLRHVCFGCRKELFRSQGIGYIEVRCNKCKAFSMYDTTLMRSGKWRMPVKEKTKKTIVGI